MSEIPQATAHFVDTSVPSGVMPPPPPTYERDFSAATNFLNQNQWPVGLQQAFFDSCNKFPIRFMIIDDSGSMMTNDGHYLLTTRQGIRSVECSRWKELADSMKFHARLSYLADACTEFRLLNGAQPIVIGNTPGADKLMSVPQLDMLNALLDGSPSGGTPLCRHIREVVAQISQMAPQLRANGHRAVVTIATDGESSDGDMAAALKPLENLPVWVVVRLCTDDDRIVDYWNNIDAQLELEMDVLDDLFGEAAEVNSFNSWLTYGEPLHRLREGGVHIKEMDLIDEAKLSFDEMKYVCALILGIGPPSELPHPKYEWDAFFSLIRSGNQNVSCWDPLTKKQQHWIRERRLRSHYNSKCTIS